MTDAAAGTGTLRRRVAWTFAGQALSSSSNFLVSLFALTVVSGEDFAALALCLTTFLLLAQLGRALVSVPVLVLYSEEAGRAIPPGAVAAVRAAVALGLVGSAGVVGVTLALGPYGVLPVQLFLVLAAALPLLLYQDALRHVCIARHQPARAAASDAFWLALQLAGYVLLAWSGHTTAEAVLATWAGAGVAAGLWSGHFLGIGPRAVGATGWLQRHAVLCRRLVFEFVASSGSYYVVAYGVAVLAGVAELGHLRAAQALFGPASVVLLGGTVLGVPESVRTRSDGAALLRFGLGLSAGLCGVSLAAGATLFGLLPALGAHLPEGSAAEIRPLLLLLGLYGGGIGAAAGPVAALRARGDAAWIVRAQAVRGGAAVLIGVPAAVLAGAPGALAGLAVAEAGFAAAGWERFARSSRAPAWIDTRRTSWDAPIAAPGGMDAGLVVQESQGMVHQ